MMHQVDAQFPAGTMSEMKESLLRSRKFAEQKLEKIHRAFAAIERSLSVEESELVSLYEKHRGNLYLQDESGIYPFMVHPKHLAISSFTIILLPHDPASMEQLAWLCAMNALEHRKNFMNPAGNLYKLMKDDVWNRIKNGVIPKNPLPMYPDIWGTDTLENYMNDFLCVEYPELEHKLGLAPKLEAAPDYYMAITRYQKLLNRSIDLNRVYSRQGLFLGKLRIWLVGIAVKKAARMLTLARSNSVRQYWSEKYGALPANL